MSNKFGNDIDLLQNKLVEIKTNYPWCTQLSDSQLLEIHQSFAKFDKDGNGTIEKRELEASMRSCGLSVEENSVDELISSVDTDNNGKIEFEEFLKLMARRILETDGEEELRVAFKTLLEDPYDPGYLDKEEASKLLTSVGKPFSTAELESFLASAKTEDGKIGLQAFLDMPCWRLPIDLKSNAKSRTSPEAVSR